MNLLHCAEATVAARAHTQLPLAAFAKRALRHAQGRSDVSHAQVGLGDKQIFEPGNNVTMMAASRRFFLGPVRQTLSQRIVQLLLQPMRRLDIGECCRARFGHPDPGPVEAA